MRNWEIVEEIQRKSEKVLVVIFCEILKKNYRNIRKNSEEILNIFEKVFKKFGWIMNKICVIQKT